MTLIIMSEKSIAQTKKIAEENQNEIIKINTLQVEQKDAKLLLSSSVKINLPEPLTKILSKGIPITFIATSKTKSSRWYWLDKTTSYAQTKIQLSYQPLTRRWKIDKDNKPSGNIELSINEEKIKSDENDYLKEEQDNEEDKIENYNYYENLEKALNEIGQVKNWEIAPQSILKAGKKQILQLLFEIDWRKIPMTIFTEQEITPHELIAEKKMELILKE